MPTQVASEPYYIPNNTATKHFLPLIHCALLSAVREKAAGVDGQRLAGDAIATVQGYCLIRHVNQAVLSIS